MKHDTIAWKRITAVLCIILVLVYVSIASLSYAHECLDSKCAICSWIENSRNLLVGIAIMCAVSMLNKFGFIIVNIHSHILSVRDGTPVGLKVKLSD